MSLKAHHHVWFLCECTRRRYNNQLVNMSQDLGDRLMRAFDTETGLPYSRINLRHGLDEVCAVNTAL